MKREIVLPQVRFLFDKQVPENEIIFVAGGRPPELKWLTRAAESRTVWCVDRGIDICKTGQIFPQRIIGDGDSASSDGWSWGVELGIPVEIYHPDKNLTDLQLALQSAGRIYETASVIVTGVWGGRFDHAFSNVFSLIGSARYGVEYCCAADEAEVMLILKGGDCVDINPSKPPEIISLLPLSAECCDVSIDGVRWPLRETRLRQYWPYAVSNRPAGNVPVSVSIKSGWLGIYLGWEKLLQK